MGINGFVFSGVQIRERLASRLEACRFEHRKDGFDYFYAPLRQRNSVECFLEGVATCSPTPCIVAQPAI